MKIQLIRNATLRIEYGGHTFLTDPYFAPKFSMPTYASVSKNPLVDLPISIDEILSNVEIILLSHIHSDHFDPVAQSVVPKSSLLFCQPDDKPKLKEQGFTNCFSIEEKHEWNGIHIERIYGKHGSGDVLCEMGNTSGYLLSAATEPSIFWAGDTVLCDETKEFILKKNRILSLSMLAELCGTMC